MTLGSSLVVDLSDLHHTSVRPLALSDDALPPEGSALLAVERFAVTANNISYALHGEAMGTWSFFPAPDGQGHVPVWGVARVLHSGHPDVEEGARVFGLLPMATHLLVSPADRDARGFTDGSPHRADRAAIYNRYLFRDVDPMAAASPAEDLEVAFRPSFTMAFLLEAELAGDGYHDADAVIFTSASSRTALGAAHLIHTRATRPALVGLTHAAHLADVAALGCYDRVLTYDDVHTLPVGRTAVVDLSGDGAVVAALHRRLADSLVHSSIVGATHWSAAPVDTASLPGAQRTFFLAPQAARRLSVTAGDAAVEAALAAGWRSFSTVLGDWARLHRAAGPDAVAEAYRRVLDGAVSPRDVLLLTMRT